MDDIIGQIMQWGKEKGINNPVNQFKKLCEETLETQEAYDWCVDVAALYPSEDTHTVEEVGDIGVVWLLLCQAMGIEPEDALKAAHNKNKNRTGKTVNGNFIKDEEPKTCFDSKKYLDLQEAEIRKRADLYDKLYIEFGGKLADDGHASRVLPGFDPDLKLQLLERFKDDAEVILCINADHIINNRERKDTETYYLDELGNLITTLRERRIMVRNVVITMYDGEPCVEAAARALNDEYGVSVYLHRPTNGYPFDIELIVSDKGYGANPYVNTDKKIVVISAPGAYSGKLATSLSQVYHEYRRGVKAGYAKVETFPVWDLPLDHPVNFAYEAATADIEDKNVIDPFHKSHYGTDAVNYNRDVEDFPILRDIMRKITGEDVYYSPTDMGINHVGECITDDILACESAEKEISRRYSNASESGTQAEVDRIKDVMKRLYADQELHSDV